jgi:hypothetical protein
MTVAKPLRGVDHPTSSSYARPKQRTRMAVNSKLGRREQPHRLWIWQHVIGAVVVNAKEG